MNTERIDYIHYIRGAATFLIVLFHADLFRPDNTFSGRVIDAFLFEWTSVFVLISGFLFQYLLPKYKIKKFYLSKIKNILLPYLIISIPAIALYMMGYKNDHNWVDLAALREHSFIYQILFFYGTGAHLGPLWYIPMILMIFACAPLLAAIGRKRAVLDWLFPVCVIITFLTEQPGGVSNPFIGLFSFLPSLPNSMMALFIIGMFFCERREDIKILCKRRAVQFGLIAIFTLFFALTIIYGQQFAILQKIFLYIILINISFILPTTLAQSEWWKNPLTIVGDYSFPIYLLHGYFIAVLRMVADKFQTDSVLIGTSMAIGCAIIITILSIIPAWIAQKLFGTKSRMLVGA